MHGGKQADGPGTMCATGGGAMHSRSTIYQRGVDDGWHRILFMATDPDDYVLS